MTNEHDQHIYYRQEWRDITLNQMRPDVSGWRTDKPAAEFFQFIDFLGEINATGKVLDLGCGGGRHSVVLAQDGFDVHGIDFAPSAIGQAIVNAERASLENSPQFTVGSALDLPYPDDYFDIINDDGCLHHIKPKDWSTYMHNVTRVLKVGGIIRIKTFSKNSRYFDELKDETSEQWIWIDDGGYTYFFDESDILRLFTDKFEVIRMDKDVRTRTDDKAFFIGVFGLVGDRKSNIS